ncbi:MAG TPA: hypothetical protein V6C52_02545 [Coleofasciculaceae cyanobacterium]
MMKPSATQPFTTSFPSLRFGWSEENPPKDYAIRLDGSMVKRTGDSYDPSPALVRRIADNLAGDVDKPRFALLLDTIKTLGSLRQVRLFQRTLTHRVFEELIRCFPETFNPAGNTRIVDLCFVRDGLRSSQFFHYDAPNIHKYSDRLNIVRELEDPLVSISYGPVSGCAGGIPRLADHRQAYQDGKYPCSRIPALIRAESRKLTDTLDNKYIWTLDQEFSAKDDKDTPILLFNNISGVGVLHGATPINRQLPGEFRRDLGTVMVNTCLPQGTKEENALSLEKIGYEVLKHEFENPE